MNAKQQASAIATKVGNPGMTTWSVWEGPTGAHAAYGRMVDVVCTGEDGTTVFVYSRKYQYVIDHEARFNSETPLDVIAATVRAYMAAR